MVGTVSNKTPSKLVDENLIRSLAELLRETELTEIELEEGEAKLRLARNITVAAAPVAAIAAAPAPVAAAPAAAPAAEAPAPASAADAASHPGAVKSPMVGTVYSAPKPDAAPFVTVGASVTKGQTLMIVEAMKTMNPIPAPASGTVTQILVENAQPVEFDQPLVIIE